MNDIEAIHPFRVEVGENDLSDLRERLARIRWAPEPSGPDADYGVTNARVRQLAEYWRDHYDWRFWEAKLNAYAQYTTIIDGARVHFVHVRSPEPHAIPLILSHGWPGSVFEYLNVIGPLSDPARHGLDPKIAFDVVVPSLPGFAFSGPTSDTGWGVGRIARAWTTLMTRLGYHSYGAGGNDWGSAIAPELGRAAPGRVIGAHITQSWCEPPDDPELLAGLSERDRAAMEAWSDYLADHASYGMVQAQQPQTLAHALSDSPVGLLGWNVQAMNGSGLDAEAILTHVCAHWLTNTAGSAIRIYAEAMREQPIPVTTTVPVAVAQFADDLPSVRAFTERNHDLRSWTAFDRGSHYGSYDAPDLYTGDVRQFFAGLRS